METKSTICIMCPMGCPLTVEIEGDNYKVLGNTCKRGEIYGIQEMKNPMRVVTSLVKTESGSVLSVKTNNVIPKTKIFEILNILKTTTAKDSTKIGDVIVQNVLNLGVDVVATQNADFWTKKSNFKIAK